MAFFSVLPQSLSLKLCIIKNLVENTPDLVVQDGYIKDGSGTGTGRQSWDGFVRGGFKGDASVNCSINDACEAECVYGGCDPIEVCFGHGQLPRHRAPWPGAVL